MRKISLILILLITACSTSPTIPTTTKTAITLTATIIPSNTLSPTPRPTFKPPVKDAYIYFSELEAKVDFEGLKCLEFFWEEVNMEVETGTVQRFIIRGQHAQPDAEILCSGYFVIPPELGKGLLIYKELENGLQIIEVKYTQNDINQNIPDFIRNTTPTPSQ